MHWPFLSPLLLVLLPAHALPEGSCSSGASTVATTPARTLLQVVRQQSQRPHVCIVARVCGPDTDCAPGPGSNPDLILRAFLSSMSAQSYPFWELHLINSRGGGEVFQDVVAALGDARLQNGPTSSELLGSNSWGYEATNFALDQLLQGIGTQAPCEYFLFTNADNLYGRFFLETGLPGMVEGRDLLGFNFVTRYPQKSASAPPLPPHMPMKDVGFQIGHIDLGSVLVSAEAIRETGARFGYEKISDWNFFEELLHRPNAKGHSVYGELQYFHQFLSTDASSSDERLG